MAGAKTDLAEVVSDQPHQGRYKLLKQEVEIYLSVDHPNIARLRLASKWPTRKERPVASSKVTNCIRPLDVCPYMKRIGAQGTKVHRFFEIE